MGLRGRKASKYRVLNRKDAGKRKDGRYGQIYYFSLPPGVGEPLFEQKRLWHLDVDITQSGHAIVSFTETDYMIGDRPDG